MAITLEPIYEGIEQVGRHLHRAPAILDDEGELTDEACQKLQKARNEMDKGKYISHEEIMAKYGLLR